MNLEKYNIKTQENKNYKLLGNTTFEQDFTPKFDFL